MRRTWGPASLAVAVVGGLVGLVGPAASGVSWYSASSPLKAYEDGVVQAAAYGNFYNYQNTYARSSSNHRDVRAGGNAAYVDTDFYFWLPCTDGNTCYKYVAGKESPRTTSSAWLSSYRQEGLNGSSDKARGRMHVCEDQNNSGDPCSAWVTATFGY